MVDLYHLAQSSQVCISTHPQGSEIKVIKQMLHQLPPQIKLTFLWVKAHVGFAGNEVADAVAKWAVFFLPPPSMPPPPNGISRGPFPVLGKLLTTHTRHKVPCHNHTSLHVPNSFDWLSKNFTKSKQNFKWVTNSYSMRHYAPHYDMHHYLCPECHKHHQMNPTSVISFCQNIDALRQQFVQAWPPSFKSLVNQWITDIAVPAGKTHFFRTLIPSSLLTYLHCHRLPTPLSHPVPAEWYEALSRRSRLTTECVCQSIRWLHDNQPPSFFHSRSRPNYWSSGQFST